MGVPVAVGRTIGVVVGGPTVRVGAGNEVERGAGMPLGRPSIVGVGAGTEGTAGGTEGAAGVTEGEGRGVALDWAVGVPVAERVGTGVLVGVSGFDSAGV